MVLTTKGIARDVLQYAGGPNRKKKLLVIVTVKKYPNLLYHPFYIGGEN